MQYVKPNDLSSALCNMYDIRNKTRPMWHKSKDGDGSIFTVKDCLDEVVQFLESLEENSPT